MKPVITPDESARLDAVATDPVEVLMDRAGFGVAVAAAGMGAGYGTKVIMLCGPGNNGGDGYVAARYLRQRGADVSVRALVYPKGEDSPARRAGTAATAAGVPIEPLQGPEEADLVVDALFGSGFHGVLDGPVAMWSEADRRVLSVDLPSGLNGTLGTAAGPCFTAERTVTFGALKTGHLLADGPSHSGRVEVVDIGLGEGEAEFFLCEPEDAPIPPRPRDAHKWSAGSVLVIGGSRGLTGAPLLAALAALHSGAGAVKLACPGRLEAGYASHPEIMTIGIGDDERFDAADVPALLAAAERFDVVVLGPGLGPDQEKFVAAIADGVAGNLLIDADALNAIGAAEALATRDGETILTPHGGEFRRLTEKAPTPRAAGKLAAASSSTVVLKGPTTFVAGSERWAVASGGPELATVGTGDVLAGAIAALWSRGLDAEVAARAGAFWHGRAGTDLARQQTVTADALAVGMGRFL
ncbi:MAG: NAD(P)H-hydrate dehydratase [Acidimicrobiia bacterium]|nr:NAD(P)H-hydrate dehydratase [Acidimicrobiia bacterium]